jgi:hypothetical protein
MRVAVDQAHLLLSWALQHILSALSDVQLSSSTGGQLLSYNQTGGYWKNTSITAGTGITVTPTAGGDVTIASTVTSGVTITDDTTTNATRYITFSNVTTGNETTLRRIVYQAPI